MGMEKNNITWTQLPQVRVCDTVNMAFKENNNQVSEKKDKEYIFCCMLIKHPVSGLLTSDPHCLSWHCIDWSNSYMQLFYCMQCNLQLRQWCWCPRWAGEHGEALLLLLHLMTLALGGWIQSTCSTAGNEMQAESAPTIAFSSFTCMYSFFRQTTEAKLTMQDPKSNPQCLNKAVRFWHQTRYMYMTFKDYFYILPYFHTAMPTSNAFLEWLSSWYTKHNIASTDIKSQLYCVFGPQNVFKHPFVRLPT